MIMKCRKINGIEKNVCTAEQMIAYNYAFSWRDCYIRRTKEATTAIQKDEVLQDIINFVTSDVLRRDDMKKYNADAIVVAFRQGFASYIKDFFIASDYVKIGKVFKIPYEII